MNDEQDNQYKSMKNTIVTAVLLLTAVFASGCAQVMALKQPKPFAPCALASGAKRTDIVGELGQPVSSEDRGHSLTDTYKYVDGGKKNCGGSKTARVVLYTAGDLFTCWLDQLIWMPVEKFAYAGIDHAVTVDYIKSENGVWIAKEVSDKPLKGRSSKKETL